MKHPLHLLLFFVLSVPGRAYVTSAVFETNMDTPAKFYLNGNQLGEVRFDKRYGVRVLSTSDDTLPLWMFKNNETNVFAIDNQDIGDYRSGQLGICYRLTIYHSDGDPVVLWSTPEQAKLLHLSEKDPLPQGWQNANFDDSKWVTPNAVFGYRRTWGAWVELKDNAFDQGFVPHLSHNAHTFCQPGDRNLIRSKFDFPNRHASIQVRTNPAEGVGGRQMAVQLQPGPDVVGMDSFNVLAWIPQGMEVVQASQNGAYDKQNRRLSWKYNQRDMKVNLAELGVSNIIKAPGWNSPNVVLGGNKEDLPYQQGAEISHGLEGWFKMAAPKLSPADYKSRITGVIIYSQIMPSGNFNKARDEVDKILFNYSVDGGRTSVMKRPVNIARTAYSLYEDGGWVNGYYDATADLNWTWKEVLGLAVSLKSQQVITRDVNRVASIVAIVRYADISEVAPVFTARITSNQCETLAVKAAIFRNGQKGLETDVAELRVNAHACAPTPVPTRIPTPVPLIAMVAPTPEPTQIAAVVRPQLGDLGLGCLSVSPEPFDIGGTFVNYCLKRSAEVTLIVYSASDGKAVRRIVNQNVRAGKSHQIFFNSRTEDGSRLPEGEYIVELQASGHGVKATLNTTVRIVKNKKKGR